MFNGTFKLSFLNNTAVIGGDNIQVAGQIGLRIGREMFFTNAENTLEFMDTDDVSSNPTCVFMCSDHIINCTVLEHSVDIFPGQT